MKTIHLQSKALDSKPFTDLHLRIVFLHKWSEILSVQFHFQMTISKSTITLHLNSRNCNTSVHDIEKLWGRKATYTHLIGQWKTEDIFIQVLQDVIAIDRPGGGQMEGDGGGLNPLLIGNYFPQTQTRKTCIPLVNTSHFMWTDDHDTTDSLDLASMDAQLIAYWLTFWSVCTIFRSLHSVSMWSYRKTKYQERFDSLKDVYEVLD